MNRTKDRKKKPTKESSFKLIPLLFLKMYGQQHLPPKGYESLTGKFVLVKLDNQYSVVVTVAGNSHAVAKASFSEFLLLQNFKAGGEYQILGGGYLDVEEQEVTASGYSEDYGRFDESRVEQCLSQAFPEKQVKIDVSSFVREKIPFSATRCFVSL